MLDVSPSGVARRDALRVVAVAPLAITARMTDPTPITPWEFGALGDGSGTSVAEWLKGGAHDRGYLELSEIQAEYPHVRSLDDTIDWAAVQKAFAAGVELGIGISFVSSKAQFISNRTLRPGGQFTLDAAGATVRFVRHQSNFTRIKDAAGTPTQLKLAWDMTNAAGSTIRGRLELVGAAVAGKFDLSARQAIDHDLVAISASESGGRGDGSNTLWESLDIVGFGYGLFTIDNSSDSLPVQPFTRCVFQLLEIRYCRYPIWFGRGRNSFDDSVVITYRQARCSREAMISATEFTAVSAFVHASKDEDAEPQTVDGKAAGTRLVVRPQVPPNWLAGMSIIVEGGGSADGQGVSDFVTIITDVMPNHVQLADAIERDVSRSRVWIDLPPAFVLDRATLNVQRLYLEGRMYAGIVAREYASIVLGVLKLSNGHFSSRNGIPIWLIGLRATCSIRALHERTLNNRFIRGIVAAAKVRRGLQVAERTIDINVGGLAKTIQPVIHVVLPDDLFLRGIERSDTTNDRLSVFGK